MESSIENWLNNLSPKGRKNALSWFTKFQDWLKTSGGEFKDMTANELITYMNTATNEDAKQMFMMVTRYVNSLHGLSVNTKKNYYFNIRSFFKWNYTPLPSHPVNLKQNTVAQVQSAFSITEVKMLIDACVQPVYKAIYLCMFQGALDLEMFMHWNMTGLESTLKQLKDDPDVIRIDLPGRKKMRNVESYYSLIASDAIHYLRLYLKTRVDSHDTGAIFLSQRGQPISGKMVNWMMRNRFQKIGVITKKKKAYTGNRYGYNPHEMRDIFRTQWEYSPASGNVAEFMLGHQIDSLGYNKGMSNDDYVRHEHKRAIPWLNIMTNKQAFGLVPVDEVEALRAEIGDLHAIIERKDQAGERTVKGMDEVLKTIAELQAEVNKMKAEKGLGE